MARIPPSILNSIVEDVLEDEYELNRWMLDNMRGGSIFTNNNWRQEQVEFRFAPTPTTKKKYYAGVGSRQTPRDIIILMEAIASKLSQAGWSCRSGGAAGADRAFERGARCILSQYVDPPTIEIFTPGKKLIKWNYSRSSDSWFNKITNIKMESWLTAEEIASEVHPVWNTLSQYPKSLITRNTFQVLGLVEKVPEVVEERVIETRNSRGIPSRTASYVTGRVPEYIKTEASSFVLCWTPDGAVEETSRRTGGTGQAIRLANKFNIPVFNLARIEHKNRLEEWINL